MARSWKAVGGIWDGSPFLRGNFFRALQFKFSYSLRKQIKDYSNSHTQVPVYIAEITPKNLRGGFTTVHQVN